MKIFLGLCVEPDWDPSQVGACGPRPNMPLDLTAGTRGVSLSEVFLFARRSSATGR